MFRAASAATFLSALMAVGGCGRDPDRLRNDLPPDPRNGPPAFLRVARPTCNGIGLRASRFVLRGTVNASAPMTLDGKSVRRRTRKGARFSAFDATVRLRRGLNIFELKAQTPAADETVRVFIVRRRSAAPRQRALGPASLGRRLDVGGLALCVPVLPEARAGGVLNG